MACEQALVYGICLTATFRAKPPKTPSEARYGKSNWDPFMFLKVKLNSSQAASLLRENREKAKVKRCEDYFTWRYLKALCMDVIFNFK